MSDEHRNKYYPQREKLFKFYNFYNSKDGDECLKKTVILSGYAGTAGTMFGLLAGYASITVEKTEVFSNVITRLVKYSLPMFAAGGTFAAATCTVSKLRGGQDGPLNHFLAGLVTGTVFGAAYKSQKVGCGAGLAIGLVASIIKCGFNEGHLRVGHHPINRQTAPSFPLGGYLTTRPNPLGDQVTDA